MKTHSFRNKNSHGTAHSQITTDGEKSTQMGICLSACDPAVTFVSTGHLCPLLLCKAQYMELYCAQYELSFH